MSKLSDKILQHRDVFASMTAKEAAVAADCSEKIFRKIAKEYDIKYMPANRKKRAGYDRSVIGVPKMKRQYDVEIETDDEIIQNWQRGPREERICTYPGCKNKAVGWFRCKDHPFPAEPDMYELAM